MGVAKGTPRPVMQGRGRGWGSGAGWPSRYDPKLCKTVFQLRSLGLSVRDIAGFLDVSAMTTYIWRKKYPEFATAWERGGLLADAKVAYSLWRRATGWSHEATRLFNNRGTIIKVPYIERYPPDIHAIELWLTNRQPDVWKRRSQLMQFRDRKRARRRR